jgi:C1A family cysteine protease
MEQENSYKELEKKARNKTTIFLLIFLTFWMIGLFFFLNQSRHEQSLIFAKVLPTGLIIKPFVVVDDTSKIDPNADPNTVIVDTSSIDTTIKIGSAYSLRPFAPNVMSQGQLGSCVSWASAYAGFTILRRVENNSNSHQAFSPLNLYVRYKKQFNEDPCSFGASIPYALNILKSNGCELFNNFLPNDCSKDVAEDANYQEKLNSFKPISSSSISTIKSVLSQKMPVVIGIKCYDGNYWENAVLNDGVWSGYYSGEYKGGHAMCLVGYDDNKAGGAFEIMNSWGDDWGDKGFFWIKYNDFVKHVDECYALIPDYK